MFRTALISLDHSAAQGPLLDCLADLRGLGVGKHGRGWVESMAIGSTAANLCEIARRPVLVVPLTESEI